MKLTLEQTAERLGKTRRQIRYMIEQGKLPAEKVGGRWAVDAEALPVSEAAEQAEARKQLGLRAAVEKTLDPGAVRGRYSIQHLKAITLALPLYRRCTELFGEDSVPARELRAALDQLAIGYHRYAWSDKREAYNRARDAVSRAGMAVLISGHQAATELLGGLEQELIPAIAGVLRRTDRRGSA